MASGYGVPRVLANRSRDGVVTSSICGHVANTKRVWLRTFSGRLADDLGLDLDNPTESVQEGEWQSDLKDDWNPDNICEILHAHSMSA